MIQRSQRCHIGTVLRIWGDGRVSYKKQGGPRSFGSHLFLTLIWQQATSIPKIRPHLESTVTAERFIHSKVQFNRLFMKNFEMLLRDELVLRPAKNLVIINALDECDSDQD